MHDANQDGQNLLNSSKKKLEYDAEEVSIHSDEVINCKNPDCEMKPEMPHIHQLVSKRTQICLIRSMFSCSRNVRITHSAKWRNSCTCLTSMRTHLCSAA